jgi:hypothetical protein
MTRRDHADAVGTGGKGSPNRPRGGADIPILGPVLTKTTRRAAALLTGALLALPVVSVEAPTHAATARADDGFFAGKVVNQANGKPVKGVTVKVFRINTDTLLGSDKTGSEGRYRIDGLSADDEELDVRVNGRAVGFESGWAACNHKIVPSWADACSYSQGRQTPLFIQHL